MIVVSRFSDWLSIADVARMYAGAARNETNQESCLEPTVLRQAWKSSYRLSSNERYLNGLNVERIITSKINFLHLISLHHIAPLSFKKFFCRDEWIRLCSEKDRNVQKDQNVDKVTFKCFLEMYTAGSKEMRAFCMEEKVLDNVCKDKILFFMLDAFMNGPQLTRNLLSSTQMEKIHRRIGHQNMCIDLYEFIPSYKDRPYELKVFYKKLFSIVPHLPVLGCV